MNTAIEKWAYAYHVEFFTFDWGDMKTLMSRKVYCENCTAEEAFAEMAGEFLYLKKIPNGDGTERILILSRYCRPELGALAPLPPCEARPLHTKDVRSTDPRNRSGRDLRPG